MGGREQKVRVVWNTDLYPIAVPRNCTADDLKSWSKHAANVDHISSASITFMWKGRPLQNDGPVLDGVDDDAVIEVVKAAGKKVMSTDTMLADIHDINTSAEALWRQMEAGELHKQQTLDALTRQLFRIDAIKAPAGSQLPVQVATARKASVRKIQSLCARLEADINMGGANLV